ncbi:MAG: RNase adapter RapZ [Ruminococcaceae bacterium]|nr:RNase adapter RapZ [Oscillospiraceae bacterium]
MKMEFVIVTGLSGSGKSSAVKVLEDIGYFCIDNMPPQLIPDFAAMCNDNDEITKVAIVTDIRGGAMFFKLGDSITKLHIRGINVKVLFLEASREVLNKRYKETRRKHPLEEASEGDITKAIDAEIELLGSIRENADYIVDSSMLSTGQLKEQIAGLFLEKASDGMLVSCMSFGFKYGAPGEADLVFDVRCLPNPFYLPELKHKTGLDKEVRDYVMSFPQSVTLQDKLFDLIEFLIPHYVTEGKSRLVIAFGCTGGKHRSVTFAEHTAAYLRRRDFRVRTLHRDVEKK